MFYAKFINVLCKVSFINFSKIKNCQINALLHKQFLLINCYKIFLTHLENQRVRKCWISFQIQVKSTFMDISERKVFSLKYKGVEIN